MAEPAGRFALAALLVVLAVLPARQLLEPTGPLEQRERNPVWVQQLRALNAQIGAQRAVVFNVPRNVDAMFYTPYVVYPHTPSPDEVRSLRDRGYQVYVFRSQGTLAVPY